jgi:hypothetical protein
MNPNDAIREQILRYFYDRNATATSRHGKKGSAVKISDVKRELRERYSLSQQQVMSNLTYLIDREWIKTFEIEKTVTVKGGTIPSAVTWFVITAQGIEKIEGDSDFKPQDRYAGINITATGSNIITLGDGNVVNAEFRQLHAELNALKDAVTSSGTLTDGQKLDVAADIESIKDQLAKSEPNKSVVRQLWSGVERVVTGSEFVDLMSRAGPAIAAFLS